MEIFSDDMGKLQSIIEEWKQKPDIELEATFGAKDKVDMQTFLRVASRLKSKGFECTPQEDRLTVSIPDQVRFSVNGFGMVQQYCRDNNMAGKKFTAMIKDRATAGISNVDLRDYDTRVKIRREVPLGKDDSRVQSILADWASKKKYFRLIKRWTFHSPTSPGLIFDLSMVRSTIVNKRTGEAWVDTFQRQAITTFTPTYEIEVELDREGFPEDSLVQDILKRLLTGIGDILRGIQGTPVLIRKSTKERVLKEYLDVVKTDRFRGVAPVTLELKNMSATMKPGVPNIREGYNVTDKADGLRVHAFTDESGELFMIDMSMNVYKTGLQKPDLARSLLDGEYVTIDKKGQGVQALLIFDMYNSPKGEDITKLPFQGGRHEQMKRWFEVWVKDGGPRKLIKSASLSVSMKAFYFGEKGNATIFREASKILMNKKAFPYNTDGLILTPNDSPLPGRPGVRFSKQFKWKPAEDNSIDFLASTEKDVEITSQDKITIGIHPTTGGTLRYKTLRLFVGSSLDQAYTNPRDTILSKLPLPQGPEGRDGKRGEYKPILFNPSDFPDIMANTCYLEIFTDPDTSEEYVRTALNEPIRDKSIVEMRYDPKQPPGWRWLPMRIRTDKTERLQKGIIERSLNNEETAESVWNSIHEPITESMIRTGNDIPSQEEQLELASSVKSLEVQKKYWERKASARDIMKVRGLRDFHNLYIKNEVLYGSFFKTGQSLSILDIAVGKAGDIGRWQQGRAGFVFGIDYAGENITDPKDGAYRRYMNLLVEARNNPESLPVPNMFFAIGDGSKRLITGEAGATDQESDIMKSILGKIKPTGAIPPLVDEKGAGRLSNGTDGFICMFALHYFFEKEETLNGFLQNIDDTLKVGGYFLGSAFDGQSVFNFLRAVQKGKSRSGVDQNTVVWEIRKEYEADELPVDETGLGMPIDVEFISIGAPHREYLISWEFLVRKMQSIGCELLDANDLKTFGLEHSTNLFKNSYDMAYKSGKKYIMSDTVKEYSFLNRWFIFKRVRKGDAVAVEESENEESTTPYIAEGNNITKYLEAQNSAQGDVVLDDKSRTEFVESIFKPTTGTASTAPTAPPTAAPAAASAAPTFQDKKVYKASEIFSFYMSSLGKDTLKIGDKFAARWLSPTALFAISDPANPEVLYPSMEHFMAGMKLTLASNKPQLGAMIFGKDGTIHQKYLGERRNLQVKKRFTESAELDSMKKELEEINDTIDKAATKNKGLQIDNTKWGSEKQNMIDEAIHQRLKRDPRFCKIVAAIVAQKLYPVYYTGTKTGSELGGTRRVDGTIDGQNKIGKAILTQAFKYPETIEECST